MPPEGKRGKKEGSAATSLAPACRGKRRGGKREGGKRIIMISFFFKKTISRRIRR